MLTEWNDERTLVMDDSVLFSKGYDFFGLEYLCVEARGPDGRYIVWPSGKRWSLYRESDGALEFERYATEGDARAQCESMMAAAAKDGRDGS